MQTLSAGPWRRWSLFWGAPCAVIALGTVWLAVATGVRSTAATAMVIVGALAALFTFVLSMPRHGNRRDEG
ncbi:hypothetical protein ACODT5_00215 [Streptomyces sp. 5.8]|uniref:hypothetical protein n=1 Tax=Streptomyces sp. 5.8 TaxID=3406571 RepID=UPI003BB6551C